MYPEQMVKPMREELTRLGIQELRTPEEVDEVLGQKSGTSLVVVNSICGCAAGNARPAITTALGHKLRPERLTTVFAGQDKEATARARSYIGHQPSSPSVALLKDGECVFVLHRHDIEGRTADVIASDIKSAFDQHCSQN